MDAPGGIDQAGDLGGQPPLPPQDTPQMTETDMPLEQGNAMMAAEGQTPDMADETVAKMQGMHDQGQHLPPDAPMQQTPPPQGQPPVDPQIMAQEQMGQPPIEQAPMGQPPAGQPPMGQGMPPMQGQPPHRGIDASGAPQGQPPMQQQIPPGGVEQGGDPRLASEAAMGQALTQAQASLNTTPAQQQMHQQQPQGQPPVQPGGPVAQNADLPVLSHGNQMVAMPGNTRQMQMMQPQYMPQPTAEQLPLEMRNNLEEIVKQLLKPLLREWLERNLPELLQNSIDPQTGKIDPDKM